MRFGLVMHLPSTVESLCVMRVEFGEQKRGWAGGFVFWCGWGVLGGWNGWAVFEPG